MASVGSLTSSTSNSIRGYGGLASGLDRDELIKGMTIGTTSKLNQQEQKKQKIEWMQEAVRAISDKMISFHGKYTETLTSSSNLFSSMLWGRNKITTTGTNSKYVSVSGTASSADAMTIMGIKQKAQNASWSTTKMASDCKLSSDTINTKYDKYATLDGKTLDFTYGDKSYSVVISGTDADLQDASKVAERINSILAGDGYKVEDGKTLADLIKVEAGTDGKFTIKANDTPATTAEGEGEEAKVVKLTGGSALQSMGFTEALPEGGQEIDKTGATSKDAATLQRSWADTVKGQTLTFSYNGTSASVKIADDVKTLEDVRKSLQDSLDAKFGKDRVKVEIQSDPTGSNKGKLTFKTTVPGKGEDDDTSVLKLTGGSSDALKALKLDTGASNRVNLNGKLSQYGFKATSKPVLDEDGKPVTDDAGKPVKEDWYSFKLNGIDIEVKADSKVGDLMNAINKSGANVTVSYQEAADKFTFTSKEDGASGVIDFKGNDDTTYAALKNLFGIDANNTTEMRGKDAIVAVKYAGSEDVVELRRGTNSFTVDGLTINVKGEFGYTTDASGKKVLDPATEAIEVDATVDVDRLMSTIKSFIEDYNSIVDLVNGELTTKHDRDYDPLTSDQKEELSENEISKWETKAKEGLLYGDSDLRSLSMDLRVVVSGGLLVQFEKVGISLSSNYSDNGKLSIDETKLRAALETNPESVEKLFTSKAGVDAEGNETFNGLATNLKNVMNKYVKTTGSMEEKGILIRKAGSKSAALSLTQNTYYDQLTSIDKLIATLQARLKTEQDRYISQFSALETMINNMNSQASYLSSM